MASSPSPRNSTSDSLKKQSSSANSAGSLSQRSTLSWYQRTFGRPAPSSPKKQPRSPLRPLTAVRELATRSSRQTLRKTTSNQYLGLRYTSSEDSSSTVTRLPGDPQAPGCRPPTLIAESTDLASLESLTPDQSGDSNDINQPQRPASSNIIQSFPISNPQTTVEARMGNTMSGAITVIRKPVPAYVEEKECSSTKEAEVSPVTETSKGTSPDKDPEPVPRHRVSMVKVPIPRRRSSLTTIHLDRSHFGTPVAPGQGKFNHRSSSFSESFRPTTGSLKSATPTPQNQGQGGDTLSPPLLSPTISNSRPSTANSGARFSSSLVSSHIHLPATFPGGAIATPKPSLTDVHYRCYQEHVRIRYSQNKKCPVPCMTCGVAESDSRWKCIWCALRICGGCMAEFDSKGRDLNVLMQWVAQQEMKKRWTEKGKEGSAVEQGKMKSERTSGSDTAMKGAAHTEASQVDAKTK